MFSAWRVVGEQMQVMGWSYWNIYSPNDMETQKPLATGTEAQKDSIWFSQRIDTQMYDYFNYSF